MGASRRQLLDDIDAIDDPEVLVDGAWRILERVRQLARDPRRYRLDLIVEGCESAQLDLIEVGLNRFRDIDPGPDDED